MNSSQTVKDVTPRPDTQLDPISLRKMFLRLIRNHYADPANFGDVPEAFKRFTYSDNPKERTVDVELDFLYDNYKLEQRPAIFVGFEDFDFSKQILNNTTGYTEDFAGIEYDNLVKTNLTIKHINLTPDEAQMMGIITTAFLRGVRHTIMSSLELVLFDVTKLSKVQFVNPGADKQFLCATSAILAWHDTWTTYIESHRIKKINYSV